jgi:probable rRNA maturation factor
MAASRLPALSLSLQFGRFKGVERHRVALPRHSVTRWIRHALDIDGEITVRIVDADEGQRLNREFRGKDYATNVLSFPYSAKPLEGDLVICAPVVAREAREQGKPLRAHHAHMLVHGLLHLAGLDHERASQANRMESRERAVLARLGFDDPYA